MGLFFYLLSKNKISIVKTLLKMQNKSFLDKNGNNLAHYAAILHNDKILDIQNVDVNLLNKDGKAPIHLFIENSFYVDKKVNLFDKISLHLLSFFNRAINLPKYLERKIFLLEEKTNKINIFLEFNEKFLVKLLSLNLDINKRMIFQDRLKSGWSLSDYGSYGLNYNLGSPIELLVSFFWKHLISYENKDNESTYFKYFNFLVANGANINLLFKDDTNDFDSQPTRIFSFFFLKFISKESEYKALKPAFLNKNLDFSIIDDQGNNLLHNLFSRISAKKHRFSNDFCISVISDLIKNPSFSENLVFIKNNQGLTPLDFLKDESIFLKKHFISFYNYNNISNSLVKKIDKLPPKKIKI